MYHTPCTKRCGDYKVYYNVDAGGPAGILQGVQPAGNPAIFNLLTDPEENIPLKTTDPNYAPAMHTADAARQAVKKNKKQKTR